MSDSMSRSFRRMLLVFCAPVLWSFLTVVDGQEVETFTVQYQVLEEVQPGTVLGRLPEELGWTEGGLATGTFQLLPTSAGLPLRVDSRDGLLSTARRLDREQLCFHRDPCIVSCSVLAAKYFALIHVEIHVLDINDNGPRFPHMALELEISESALSRTRLPLDQALDPDTGANSACSYILSPSEHFGLETTLAPDGTQRVELVMVKEVDRELCSSFELILTAVDHGEPPRSGTTLVRVTVLDSNDNSPTFAQSSVTVEIREDAMPGTLLFTLTASDPDQGPNGEIEYSLSKHAPAEVLRTFTVEGQTGRVLLQQPLDYEETPAYELDVQARDRGANPIPAHCKLLVRVLDVNDNVPDLHVSWARRAAVLSEGQPKDSFVALVTASDPDSGASGQVDCYIRQGGEHFTLRRLRPGSYTLLTNGPLDRESWAEHNLTLLVQDQGTPLLAATRHFTVHVSDVNDNAPTFESPAYHISIAENSVPRSALLVVRAHDADTGPNGEVVYRIADPAISAWFTIDAASGKIWARAPLDAEKMASVDFLVVAEDAGQPRLSSNVSVRVTVLDVNDNSPVIIKPELEDGRARFAVLVDIDTGCVLMSKDEGGSDLMPSVNAPLLFTILAADADSGPNGALLYNILCGNEAGVYILDSQSGQLYLNSSNASSLVGSEWDLKLSVCDQGMVPRCTRILAKVTFDSYREHTPESFPMSQPLSPSAVMGICLVGLLALVLVGLGLILSLCKREKHGNMAYNCREAEHAYSQQPKKPPKPIQKADIRVVPVLWRGDSEPPHVGIEASPETVWIDALGVPCHLTPTLYRTVRTQRNRISLVEQSERLTLPAAQRRPCCAQRFRNSDAHVVQLTDAKSCASSWTNEALSEAPLQHRDKPSLHGDLEKRHSHQHILRSLVRLSMAALAEQSPAKQLTMESAPVQQISQLLSLLHQGQVQPKPNHKGNKYTAKHSCCRTAGHEIEGLSTKEDGFNEHHDLELLGDELGHLLNSPAGLDLNHLTEADPAWMARLSLPLSSDYRDNIVPTGALSFPSPQEGTGRDESHTFATFGKTAKGELDTADTFFSEMSALFEKILAQNASPQVDVSLGFLRQLSVRSRALESDGSAAGAATDRPLESRIGNCSSKSV